MITPGLNTPKPLPLKGRQPTVPLGIKPAQASLDPPKSCKALYTKYSKAHSDGCFLSVLLPRLGPSQHLGQDVLGPDTGLSSVLPHGTQQLPSWKERAMEEAHRLGLTVSKAIMTCSKVVGDRAHNLLKRS